MNRETLYDLRALLALYPYYQTARLLMLKNLYLLHDPSFDEELRRAAIYITDRKIIFEMVEAAHYQIKPDPSEVDLNQLKESERKETGAEKHGDRTSDLIDHFLGSIPMDAEEEEGEAQAYTCRCGSRLCGVSHGDRRPAGAGRYFAHHEPHRRLYGGWRFQAA